MSLPGFRVRNPGRDISFPIFTRKEIETKRVRKEIKTIISRLNHFLSFLSNIVENWSVGMIVLLHWNQNTSSAITH